MPQPIDPPSGTRTFPGADPLSSAVLGAFMRAQHAHRQLMARKMSSYGIPPAHIFCLKEIAHHDGMNQRDLAEKMCVSRPTLTVMLQKMERAGLVERESDPNDQRYTQLHITPEGAALHDQMHAILGEVIAEMAGPMSDADKTELARLLNAMHDNIHDALGRQEA